jgi:hypothetical protein
MRVWLGNRAHNREGRQNREKRFVNWVLPAEYRLRTI